MKRTLLKLAMVLGVVLPSLASAQTTPKPILDCDRQGFMINGLVNYCQIRESRAPFAGSLNVDIINGAIIVNTWDGTDVLIRAEVMSSAESEALAQTLNAQVNVDTSGGSIRVSGPPSTTHQGWMVSFEIYIPEQAALTLSTMNGAITVEGVRGKLSLTVQNGSVTVTNTAAPIQFKVTNGSATLTRVTGNISGQTTNGTILTSVGGPHWLGQTLDLEVGNGTMEIDVPSDCSAHVDMSTGIGKITTNVPVTNWGPPKLLGQQVAFDLGSGGPLIRARASVGEILFLLMDGSKPIRHRK